MPMKWGWKPQPPKLPGYASQNINPDRAKIATTEDTVEGMRGEMDQLKKFIGVKYTLSNPSSNYASPLDAFYVRAGSLPAYLMTIPYFSMGPQRRIYSIEQHRDRGQWNLHCFRYYHQLDNLCGQL